MDIQLHNSIERATSTDRGGFGVYQLISYMRTKGWCVDCSVGTIHSLQPPLLLLLLPTPNYQQQPIDSNELEIY